MTPESAAINRQLKGLLVNHVYCNEQLAEERAAAVVKVGELFELLLKKPEYISAGHRDALAFTPPERVVCDFMAGMTDAYFLRTYDSLVKRLLPRNGIG
jgi:dGTPase